MTSSARRHVHSHRLDHRAAYLSFVTEKVLDLPKSY
jgi:hypothetical protein